MFYVIPIDSNDYHKLLFLRSATCDWTIKHNLDMIHIDCQIGYATNRKVIHRCILETAIENGFYNILPDDNKVVLIPCQTENPTHPDCTAFFDYEDCETSTFAIANKENMASQLYYHVVTYTNKCFDFAFFDNIGKILSPILPTGETFTIHNRRHENSWMALEHEQFASVIMPLDLDS